MSIVSCIRSFACLVATAALLAACGGGGNDGNSITAPAAVARVEIDASGLLLTAQGETRQLAARAFDAAGNGLTGTAIVWSSSRAAAIDVDAGGLARAASASGSAQLVASAGGISSPPLLGVVAQPASGVALLGDIQIAGDPTDSDPAAPPSFANTYRVTLVAGSTPPAPGRRVLGTGSKPVAGRVVAVDASGAQPVLVVAPVALRELLPNLAIDEVIDMANALVTVDPAIATSYAVTRSGDTFSFVPKKIAGPGPGAVRPDVRPLAATGTRALPPFGECEASITGLGDDAPLPISLAAPPLFSLSFSPSLAIIHTPSGGLQRVTLTGKPTFKVEGGISVAAAFEGKIECKADLLKFTIPVGGFLSFIAAGQVGLGASIEAGGKVTLVSMGLTTKAETSTTAAAGVQCNPAAGGCAFFGSLDNFTTRFEPKIDLPAVSDFCVEPGFGVAGTIKLEFGSPFFKSLRFEFVKAKAGAKFAGKFAPQASQFISTGNPTDDRTCGSAGYALSLDGSAGVGADIDSWLKYFGVTEISVLEVSVSSEIGGSARATEVTANRSSFVSGEDLRFAVKLDPASVNFIRGVGPYNVERVLLLRDSGGVATVVGTQGAAAGQTDFAFQLTAADAGRTDRFFAFVVTKALPADILAIGLGAPGVNVSSWLGEVTFNRPASASQLAARLVFFGDGTITGTAAGLDVSGRLDGNAISFGVATSGTIAATFTGSLNELRTEMSGTWSGRNLTTGGADAGTWRLQRCTGLDTPVAGCLR